jgi:hypothetical protein
MSSVCTPVAPQAGAGISSNPLGELKWPVCAASRVSKRKTHRFRPQRSRRDHATFATCTCREAPAGSSRSNHPGSSVQLYEQTWWGAESSSVVDDPISSWRSTSILVLIESSSDLHRRLMTASAVSAIIHVRAYRALKRYSHEYPV